MKKMLIQAKITDAAGQEIDGRCSLRLRQTMDDHHSFEASFAAGHRHLTKADLLGWAERLQGQNLTIAFLENGEERHRFEGIATSASIRRQHNGQSELVVSGFSPTILLDTGRGCAAFLEKKLSEIAATALRPFPLRKNISPLGDDPLLPYTVRQGQSAYRLLARLAAQHGQWFFHDGEQLIFGRRPETAPVELVFGENLRQFDMGLAALPVSTKRLAYHQERGDYYQAESKANLQLSEYGAQSLDASEQVFPAENELPETSFGASQKMANDGADHARRTAGSQLVRFTGTSTEPSLRPGTDASLSNRNNPGHDDFEPFGEMVITAVTHQLDAQGNYHNQFEAVPAPMPAQPRYPVWDRPAAGPQVATIADNADPKKLGRVKVRFPWQGPETTPWLHCTSAYAGADRGIYFVGEVGDQVMVGFESGDPERPFVTEVMWHGKALPPAPADGNDRKVIRTRSGNEISFLDKKDAAEICIRQEGGNEIILTAKGSGEITVRSKGDLHFEGKNISLKASQKFSVEAAQFAAKASGDMALDGAMIKLNS